MSKPARSAPFSGGGVPCEAGRTKGGGKIPLKNFRVEILMRQQLNFG